MPSPSRRGPLPLPKGEGGYAVPPLAPPQAPPEALPSRAAAALEELRGRAGDAPDTLRALERLYRTLGRERERALVLEAMLPDARGNERVHLQREIAELCSQVLSDPRRAGRHLFAALTSTEPGSETHLELLRALGEALREAGPLEAWARCAEAELKGLDASAPVFQDRRAQLHWELANAYEHRMMRPDAALRHLRPLVRALQQNAAGARAGEVQADTELLGNADVALLRVQRSRMGVARQASDHLPLIADVELR